jgi:hypothetical protein
MRFISLRVRNAGVMHCDTHDNTEILTEVAGEDFMEKLVDIGRIQSISEKYLLVSSSHGRMLYWEYQGGFAALKARLAAAGLLLE